MKIPFITIACFINLLFIIFVNSLIMWKRAHSAGYKLRGSDTFENESRLSRFCIANSLLRLKKVIKTPEYHRQARISSAILEVFMILNIM